MKSCPVCGESYADSFAHCPRDGSALMVSSGWTDGAVIRGKYRILAKIGQGGMGEVYKALHLRFNEVRALKVMSSQLASDSSFVKRFEQEAVNTRRLQHPNAVRVDDIDESEDGRPFIVMEYIEGRSLKSLIDAEGPQPVERTCRIIRQAASALAAAHEMGMVHRDIKPENIVLVSNSGGEQAKVLDFGIAKLKEAGPGQGGGLTLTGTGVVVGTPQYMSPEQAMGKRGDELDGRSDLYSLGIVMYQMLTADLPYKASTTMEMLLAHMQVPPRPIQSLRPDLKIPEAVAAVVMKCLEKKPEHRPANAAALIDELERAEKQSVVLLAATRAASSAPVLRVEPPTPPKPATVAPAAPPGQIACPRCRKMLPVSNRFCAYCGSAVTPPAPAPAPRTTDVPTQAMPPVRPPARPPLKPLAPPPSASSPAAPSPAAQARPAAPRPAAAPSIKIQTVEGSRRNLWVGVTAGALVLGLMVWYFSSRPAAQNQNGPATTPTGSSGAAVAPAQQSEPAQQPASQSSAPEVSSSAGTVRENPKDGLKYVWIPPGSFTMGCSPGDNECWAMRSPRTG